MGFARGLLFAGVVVFTLLFAVFAVVIIGQGIVASSFLNNSRCEAVLHGSEYLYEAVSLRFLFSLQACAHAMHTMITEAEESFTASFFLFQYDPESAHVVTQRIGDALLARGARPLRLVFVLDNLVWQGGATTSSSVPRTIARWKSMGVSEEALQRVEWYVYRHAWYNNLHTKLVCADQGRTTLVWSGNVETCTAGLPGACRHENGVLIGNSASLGAQAYSELQLCVAHAQRTYFQASSSPPHGVPRMEYCAAGGEPVFTAARVHAVFSHVRPSLFWTCRRDTLLAARLGLLLERATVSIDVCSPHVNDMYWWRCTLRSSAQRVRFLAEQRMDESQSAAQKYLLGNRTNSQFYSEVLCTEQDGRVQLRTLDCPGVHSKFWIIDGKIVVVGSMNFTLFSTCTSSENVLIIEDEACAQHCSEQFQRYWAEATGFS